MAWTQRVLVGLIGVTGSLLVLAVCLKPAKLVGLWESEENNVFVPSGHIQAQFREDGTGQLRFFDRAGNAWDKTDITYYVDGEWLVIHSERTGKDLRVHVSIRGRRARVSISDEAVGSARVKFVFRRIAD
jgi:hypothetical protein